MNKTSTYRIINSIMPDILIFLMILLLCLAATPPVQASTLTRKPAVTDFSIEQLMEIEVGNVFGASKFEQKITEAPSSISIITSADIRQYGYRTLGEALRSLSRLKKNGKAVYDEIKKTYPDAQALFISGYTAEIIHKKGIVEENIHFLEKPIVATMLLAKVRSILDNEHGA
jgi:hypothetical protein